jgi:hypothetical protein
MAYAGASTQDKTCQRDLRIMGPQHSHMRNKNGKTANVTRKFQASDNWHFIYSSSGQMQVTHKLLQYKPICPS